MVKNYFENGQFREFDTLHDCLGIFNSTAWNVLSLISIVICFIGHVSLIVYLVMKRSLEKKPVNSGANLNRGIGIVDLLDVRICLVMYLTNFEYFHSLTLFLPG